MGSVNSRYVAIAGLALVAWLPVASTEPAAPEHGNRIELRHPDAAWSLWVDVAGFDAGPGRARPDGSEVAARAVDAEAGLVLEARVYRDGGVRSAVACRETWWKKHRPSTRPRDVERSERDGTAVLEYTVAETSGVRIDRRHVVASRWRDGLCATVEVTAAPWDEESPDARLDAIVTSIRLVTSTK